MNMLVNEALMEMETNIKQANAKVDVQQLPSLPVYPTLIVPLFHNLISNSLKYRKQDIDPQIRIYSKISNAESKEKNLAPAVNSYCRIYVEDNGIGFDQKYSEQIFGMFQRLHHNVAEGTGIGLALCKKIVEEHGGFISAISKPNNGATFIISLPFQAS
jgi:signal transduction histidine kinase